MTLFITGGTSSIGRVLVRELAKDQVALRLMVRQESSRAGLELPGVEFVSGDVTDPEALRRGMAGCDRVVHMAAIVGHQVPETEWWRVNRDGSRNVLQAAFDLGVYRMVQVSSLSVLGHTEPGETADETRPIDTRRYRNLYQKTKHSADDIARDFAARGLAVSLVYPGFGFGCSCATSHPSMQDQTLLRMAAGKPTVVMGSGHNRLLLAYYRDTAQGIRLALAKGTPGDGYILGNESLTFPQIWAEIALVLGKQPPTRRIPVPILKLVSRVSRLLTGQSIFPPDFIDMIALEWNFSSAKARREFGLQPKSVAEAIAETWQEYQSHGWKPDR
jgi:dihydroflavonol-4-reductase